MEKEPETPVDAKSPSEAPAVDLGIVPRLNILAKARGISLGKLGEMVGCYSTQLYKLHNPKAEMLDKIGRTHGVSLDWLVRGVGPMDGYPTPPTLLATDLPALEAARAIGYSLDEIRALIDSDGRSLAGAPASDWLRALEERRKLSLGSNSRLLLK